MNKMWNCLSYICCCGCCKRDSTLTDTKEVKLKKAKKRSKKSSTSALYGTDWESNLLYIKTMTPSEIEDSQITKKITLDQNVFQDRMEWYRAIGKQVGFEFVMDEPIGKGGFGEVFKVKETKTNVIRALKVMKLRTNEDKFSASRFRAFKTEIFSLRKNVHKNIIQLVDHFIVNEWLCFMIMEFATGGDLKKRLKDRMSSTGKPFSESEAKKYLAQISNAMFFVHRNGLIHGDLKLQNVLISNDSSGKEVIKVTDFGCARVAYKEESGVVMKDKATGTVICMAPEQIRVYICVNLKKPRLLRRAVYTYNPFRADIWTLGVCLYRMLFFDYPYGYDKYNEEQSLPLMLKAMKKGFEVPKDAPKVSDDCLDLLRSLLEYNKNNRIDMQIVMKHKWLIDCPLLD